jgi:hypothetical protein
MLVQDFTTIDIKKLDKEIDEFKTKYNRLPKYLVMSKDMSTDLVLKTFNNFDGIAIKRYKGIPVAICDCVSYGTVDFIE